MRPIPDHLIRDTVAYDFMCDWTWYRFDVIGINRYGKLKQVTVSIKTFGNNLLSETGRAKSLSMLREELKRMRIPLKSLRELPKEQPAGATIRISPPFHVERKR